jgi:peroxiredoxin
MKKKNYPVPYLFDETQEVARIFGAERTPHVFVFDRDGNLVYKGALDDDYEGNPKKRYLIEVLDALISDPRGGLYHKVEVATYPGSSASSSP